MKTSPDPCPLCQRPNYFPSDHHLVPKSKGGKVTETICKDCHRTVHAFFTNSELKKTYNTIEALLTHEGFAKAISWIAKQDGRIKIRPSKQRRRR